MLAHDFKLVVFRCNRLECLVSGLILLIRYG